MNSKKNKHKNRPNKPPNPIPPQVVEQVQDKADVLLESSPKVEERVPEIISEVISTVTDVDSKPEEQPKKPKRNRGKKNQQEKVSVETQSDNIALKLEQKESKPVDENKQDATPTQPEIVPCDHKKKNKNKKVTEEGSQDIEKVLIEENKKEPIVSVDDSTLQKKNKIEKVSEDESQGTEKVFIEENKNVSVVSVEEIAEEAKHRKKNKKRKNRNDSEKSEKAEQASCIAAFQKLMKDDKQDDQIIMKSTVEQESTEIISTQETFVNKPISQESSVQKVKDNTVGLLEQSFEAPGKSKKKSKKEKKNPPSEEDSNLYKQTIDIVSKESKDDIMLHEQQIVTENPQMSLKMDEVIEIKTLKDVTSDNTLACEKNKKSNAKIAKPIEKKRKNKMSDQKRESEQEKNNESEVNKSSELSEDKPHDAVAVQTLINVSEQVGAVDFSQCTQVNPELEKNITLISSDSENAQSKGTTLDAAVIKGTHEELKSSGPVKPDQSHAKEITKKYKKGVDEASQAKETKTKQHSDGESEIETVPKNEDKRGKKEEFEKDVDKNTQKEKSQRTQNDENMNLECKTKKKRKKSPRPVADVKSLPESDKTSPICESSSGNDDNKAKKDTDVNISQFQLLADDIEIRSLQADESEGSTCGLTPDLIQYPRATSQDLIDNNNNMMIIQEVLTADVEKLNVPFDLPDTPLIKGSGEMSTSSPEIIVIDKAPTEVKSRIGDLRQPEKTDVKSKMMEVNRDMEDLRLSIEKSLAELTAIEVSEQKLEKEFDAQRSQSAEQTKVTLNTPSEILDNPMSSVENLESSSENVLVAKKSIIMIAETEDLNKPQELTLQKALQEHGNPFIITEIEKVAGTSTDLSIKTSNQTENITKPEASVEETSPPVCPTRKDHKNKGKNKKKGKQDHSSAVIQHETSSGVIASATKVEEKESKTEEKPKTESKETHGKGKQQSLTFSDDRNESETKDDSNQTEVKDFEQIENFEDAMTSSADDINKSFEIIANETNQSTESSHVNPEINITAPVEDSRAKCKKDDKINPASQPKNLLGHPDIPAPSNRIDYKKEKNKTPNEIAPKVKIKDAISIEAKRQSKESQTDNIKKFMKNKSINESFSVVTNENDDFVYKYSFRKVFLQSACHICKKELKQSRVPCSYCNLLFYCSAKHKDEDWSQHQAFCFAVSTIVHLKDQKHIYADAREIKGQNYRLLRMQMIVSCEKVLKRKLAPWEQEALLYPRICAQPSCREWRQSKLVDCDGCGQISFCADHPDHFPKLHQRWCKSYSLYQKLVCYQQTRGRLEPKMPSKVMEDYQIPERMNEVLASMYEEKLDMNDMQYAALTQIATAPLTAAYAYQTFTEQLSLPNGVYKKSTLTIHVVGAELQYEADALDKWEVFFLHVAGARRLRLVLVARDLNPSGLPLDLLTNVKVCDNCRLNDRRVTFSFQDKMAYHEYCASDDYIPANLVCAFNTNLSRSSAYNESDPWPRTINCILKNRAPLLITAPTTNDIHRDFCRVKSCAEHNYNVIIEPKPNGFASVRPDRNFLSDDEIPLLFKNYCFALIHGVP